MRHSLAIVDSLIIAGQWIGQWVGQWAGQSDGQSVDRSVYQSVSQSVDRSRVMSVGQMVKAGSLVVFRLAAIFDSLVCSLSCLSKLC